LDAECAAEAQMNVLLDLDGTLTNPEQGIVACIRHAADALERTIPADCDLARYIGPPLADAFREILSIDDPADVDAAITAYRARFATIGLFENEVYPGIPEALQALTAKGARLFLATSKPRVYATRIVEHYGLATFFQALHGSELDGTRTDKADLIAHILDTERLAAEESVMVGDRRHDVVGALRNRVRPVGVLWGFGTRTELTAAGATEFLETPAELGRLTTERE
jgi:phosphoglycolate phosphatase